MTCDSKINLFTFNHISLQHELYIIPPSCLSLVCLRANIVLLGTSLLRTKLKGERMEYNINRDAIFLTHSEMLYFLGIFIKED
jgi:hypothetical protein